MSTETENVTPAEAMRLVAQPGVVTRVITTGDPYAFFYDGDILIAFDLPDGSTLNYIAIQEGDYYGGHYDEIRWELVRATS